MFRKRNILIAILMMVLVVVGSVAIAAVLIALGVVTPDIPDSLLNFGRNVGYSVFAGGIIILMVELPKAIRDLVREDGA